MAKKSDPTVLDLLILAFFTWLLFQGCFTDNYEKVGRQLFTRIGIIDEIERLDSYIQNR